MEIDNSVFVLHRNKQVLTTEVHKVVNSLFPKMVCGCSKLNNMSACKLETATLSILGRFAQSHMIQNHSPTCDQKFGKLCQMIWKTFQQSLPSKMPLNSGRHMLACVGFVEPLSIKLVSFNLKNAKSSSSSRFSFFLSNFTSFKREILFLTFFTTLLKHLIPIFLYFC